MIATEALLTIFNSCQREVVVVTILGTVVVVHRCILVIIVMPALEDSRVDRVDETSQH